MCNDKDTGELLKSEVICSHLFTVYESQDWNVAKYVDAETGSTITACGAKLPTSKNVTIHLYMARQPQVWAAVLSRLLRR